MPQSKDAQILVQRIDQIIPLIPDSFQRKERLIEILEDRKSSIPFTAPSAMNERWREVASLLASFLPDPNKVAWAGKISKIMTADI